MTKITGGPRFGHSACGNHSGSSEMMPPVPFVLRRLTPADVEPLRKLNALFGDAFGEPET